MLKLLKTIETAVYFLVFKAGLIMSSIPARLRWEGLTRALMRANARIVFVLRRGRRREDVEDIGNEWRRMFPTDGMQEIVSVDDRTFYARTHGWCPLRGTGDLRACHRLMEFDRTLIERIGGQLVVLQSQAQPGERTCTVAIRRLGESMDDLVPAHEQGE